MTAVNTEIHFGSISKSLHWLTAALILTLLPLGLVANWWPMETQAEIATKTLLFSVHKTLGVTVFFVALVRIAWTLTQPRPRLLNADHRAEAFLAETIHWLLYVSLVIVPLSGWLEHSAAVGFAPIWWPFGQNLPLVPKDPHLAEIFAAWHWVFTKVLALALALHIAGAIKHHVIDRDATLRRMLPGRPEIGSLPPAPGHLLPAATAAGLYGLAIAGATLLAQQAEHAAETPELAAVASGWQVEEGTLAITIQQMNAPVTGIFADWTAAIEFSKEPVEGRHGSVEVTVAIPSLTLGSVTKQAMGADFFNAADHPTAGFTAEILPGEAGYVAEGTLTLKGTAQPLTLPFTLEIEGDTARMQGSATVNRRDFGIGAGVTDQKSLADTVEITVDLTATRAPE